MRRIGSLVAGLPLCLRGLMLEPYGAVHGPYLHVAKSHFRPDFPGTTTATSVCS